MDTNKIRFNSPDQRHSYEQGLAVVAAKLKADRQRRAFAAIDTAAIVRDSAREAIASLKALKAKRQAVKLAARPAQPTPPRRLLTMHKFCMGPIY